LALVAMEFCRLARLQHSAHCLPLLAVVVVHNVALMVEMGKLADLVEVVVHLVPAVQAVVVQPKFLGLAPFRMETVVEVGFTNLVNTIMVVEAVAQVVLAVQVMVVQVGTTVGKLGRQSNMQLVETVTATASQVVVTLYQTVVMVVRAVVVQGHKEQMELSLLG
jgi:hypothetical protein